ncbi:hypothetical protein SKAU_G00190780, partial [Synaphobranchus kaupii]
MTNKLSLQSTNRHPPNPQISSSQSGKLAEIQPPASAERDSLGGVIHRLLVMKLAPLTVRKSMLFWHPAQVVQMAKSPALRHKLNWRKSQPPMERSGTGRGTGGGGVQTLMFHSLS